MQVQLRIAGIIQLLIRIKSQRLNLEAAFRPVFPAEFTEASCEQSTRDLDDPLLRALASELN